MATTKYLKLICFVEINNDRTALQYDDFHAGVASAFEPHVKCTFHGTYIHDLDKEQFEREEEQECDK